MNIPVSLKASFNFNEIYLLTNISAVFTYINNINAVSFKPLRAIWGEKV